MIDLKSIKEILIENINNHASGYSLAILKDNKSYICNVGNLSYHIDGVVDDETLFDIASLSKTFTAILVLLAVQENLFELKTKILDIDDGYVNLQGITIEDLLAHRKEVWTPKHLKTTKSREEFDKLIYESYVYSDIPQYSDIHYIILGRLLEKVYKKPFEEIVYSKLRDQYNLKSLTYSPDNTKVSDTRFEHFTNDSFNEDDRLYLPHDPKSRLAKDFDMVLGHAGIFISNKDLLKFLTLLMEEKIIKEDLYRMLIKDYGTNEQNKILKDNENFDPNKSSKPYCLMGARLKNIIESENEIPDSASDKSIYFSGYTGPAYLLDFENKIIIILMCNVTHQNKLMRIERKKLTTKLINKVYENIKELD